MYTFLEDQGLRDLIEKAIIFYIFRKTIDTSSFDRISFEEYREKIGNTEMLTNIINNMRNQKIDIFYDEIKGLIKIIQDEFTRVIEHSG